MARVFMISNGKNIAAFDSEPLYRHQYRKITDDSDNVANMYSYSAKKLEK